MTVLMEHVCDGSKAIIILGYENLLVNSYQYITIPVE